MIVSELFRQAQELKLHGAIVVSGSQTTAGIGYRSQFPILLVRQNYSETTRL